MYSAGKRQHKLTVQKPVATTDPITGDITYGWQTIAEVWARIEPLRGKEVLQAEQIISDNLSRITIAYSPLMEELTTAHRGLHQNNVFNFKSIAHVKLERKEIEIMAQTGLNNG